MNSRSATEPGPHLGGQKDNPPKAGLSDEIFNIHQKRGSKFEGFIPFLDGEGSGSSEIIQMYLTTS